MLCLVWAPPAAAESLFGALVKAYETNPTIKAAEAELMAINEGVPQALSDWRPGVDLTARGAVGTAERRTANEVGDVTNGINDRDFDDRASWDAEIEVTQFLFRGGRTLASTRAAKADVEAQRARLADTEQDVLFDAVTAYMDVWRDQEIVSLNDDNVRAVREQKEATDERFRLRDVTDTDVQQAESRLARAEAGRAAAQGALASSRATYKQIIGEMPDLLEDPTSVLGLPDSLEAAVEAAVANNPAVVAAEFDTQAERQNVRVEFGELLPEVSVVGSVSRREQTLGRAEKADAAEVLAQVRVPLYERGLVSSRVRAAKQRTNQQRLLAEEARRFAEQAAVAAWEALQAARAQVAAFQVEVDSTRVALEGSREEALVGARLVLDVLNAEQEFTDARVNLVGAQRDEVVASFQVLQAMGLLTARSLGLDAQLYDAEQDYQDVKDRWYGFGDVPYLSDEW